MEVVICTLLVGLVMVTSLKSVGAVLRTWNAAASRAEQVDLARAMLAEMAQAAYIDPQEPNTYLGINTSESTTNRSNFDDIDDYTGWSASPPQAVDGSPLSGLSGWTRSVVVKKANVADPTDVLDDLALDSGLRRISVTVTAPDGDSTTLNILRSIEGPHDQQLGVAASVVVAVDCTLKAGGSPEITAGTSLINHAIAQ